MMVKSPISQAAFLFQKCNYGKISMKRENLALSKSGNYKSTEKMVIPGNLVAGVLYCVSINPVLSTIKLLR